ncbi:hypothetical protein ACEZ3G_01125 [Maribacter algicola]|uniref:Uncharacterized protein n=1 Tax=Meishania litoralis TaxID=3434685 RepID=A0ACC7LF76_9FLAO
MKNILFFSLFLLAPILVNSQSEVCNCCSESHKAFDFWIGKWRVVNPNGSMAGSNTIEKIQDNCLLLENWVGTSGNTGTSMNYYNLSTKQWEQLWVDNTGSLIKLKGNRSGNQMILSSDTFTRSDGTEYVNRITWTLNDDGTVRQLWELLENDKVVNVAFDGLYSKME